VVAVTDPYDLPAPRTVDDLATVARDLGIPKKSLLVLDPTNDPFNAGTPAKMRDAEWFAELWQRFGYTGGVHVRRIHYRAQSGGDVALPSGGTYVNTLECWQVLEAASKYARDLALVSPSLFVDRRNAETSRNAWPRDEQPSPDAEIITGHRDDAALLRLRSGNIGWYLPSIETDLSTYGFGTSVPFVTGYDYDADDQPYLLEVWVEKSTMDDVLAPVCRSLGANYTPGTGFTSKTRVAEMLHRGRVHGKPVRVFVIADYDPAGSHMPVAIARNIEFYRDWLAPDVEFSVHHIGMTRTWVDKYDLPRAPIKEDDPRKANFEAIHGEGCVELDALEALHPGALADEIRAALNAYVDLDHEAELRAAQREANRAAAARWHATVTPVRVELDEIRDQVNLVAATYRQRLSALARELDGELRPHRERLAELWEHIVELAEEDFTEELPDRPEPSVTEPDESAWLYDSRRHWWDQLQRYLARNGRAS
jgi:hypothetical protein